MAFDLSTLDGANGFIIEGIDPSSFSGAWVSDAGDVNNDGVDDVIVTAPGTRQFSVILGSDAGFPVTVSAADGFVVIGGAQDEGDSLSVSVGASSHKGAGAGDINGDGFDDVVVDLGGSSSFVVFGAGDPLPETLALSDLDGMNGFVLNKADGADAVFAVERAGDINGDGIDDLLLGHPGAERGVRTDAGAAYVVFGSSDGFPATFALSELDGTNGFVLQGADAFDYAGIALSAAGDVNNDGLDDIVIGASGADPDGINAAGATYVLFGASAGFASSLVLSDLDGTNGFQINGTESGDSSGRTVSSAGDFNGDGFDDVIIGSAADAPGTTNAGRSYVVFGTSDGVPPTLELSDLDGVNGFVLNGADQSYSGGIVSDAGDFNGDGFDDLIVRTLSGVYVVFGAGSGFPETMELSSVDGSRGVFVTSDAVNQGGLFSISAAGDVNGDQFDDIILGRPIADASPGGTIGESYVVFGAAFVPDMGVVILGDAFANQLLGSNADDALFGFGGPDGLFGFEGADSLWGDLGDDTLDGGGGNDLLIGANGRDDLSGGDGQDMLWGEGDDDTIDGGADADLLVGAQGNDLLVGADGFDELWGQADNDILDGGLGNDLIVGGVGEDVLLGDGGADSLWGGEDNDFLSGGSAVDLLVGDAGDDTLNGDEDNDELWAGEGADLINGGEGLDLLIGWIGDDILNGGEDRDELYGQDGADLMSGDGGNDYLAAGLGADTLIGGLGDDVVWGEQGNDLFVIVDDTFHDWIGDFTPGQDRIILTDYMDIRSLDDLLVLGTEADGSTLFNLGDNNFFTLNGVLKDQLSDLDFDFAEG